MDYLDFIITVDKNAENNYTIAIHSPAGEGRTITSFPFTPNSLETHLLKLENAILRSAGRRRRTPTPEEEAVQSFGQELFSFLLRDELLSRFRACQQLGHDQAKGVRIKLCVTSPELAGLPWEFLYDPTRRDYLCLDANTPLVRYPELPLTVQPLPVKPPLRILGLHVDANDLSRLDITEEQQRMKRAVHHLQTQGLVELAWLSDQTADDLQRAMRSGPWHVFHFIGHGGFDRLRDEGMILLADARRQAMPLYASQLTRLLAPQRHNLRLVLLNACEGARSGQHDLFSSTAASLVRSGIPAVLAMQYEITDDAAIQFARTFYEALADNLSVDTAVADARNALTLRNPYSLEWGTPVLYLRAPDGRLFDVTRATARVMPDILPPIKNEVPTVQEQVIAWLDAGEESISSDLVGPRESLREVLLFIVQNKHERRWERRTRALTKLGVMGLNNEDEQVELLTKLLTDKQEEYHIVQAAADELKNHPTESVLQTLSNAFEHYLQIEHDKVYQTIIDSIYEVCHHHHGHSAIPILEKALLSCWDLDTLQLIVETIGLINGTRGLKILSDASGNERFNREDGLVNLKPIGVRIANTAGFLREKMEKKHE